VPLTSDGAGMWRWRGDGVWAPPRRCRAWVERRQVGRRTL